MKAAHRDISRSNVHIDFELLDCPECIFLSDSGKCLHCVGEKKCTGNTCRFRTSAANEKKNEQEWKTRLSELSEEQQRKISLKYYYGKMPWKND